MSNKKMRTLPVEPLDATPSPWAQPRDIRDLFSYRLAYLVRLNDRHAQTVLMEQYGITLGEWRTLATIRYLGTPSLRHLARTTQQDEGLLSRYVTGLIKREFLGKRTSAEDQRVVELSLTEKGETLHNDVMIFAWKLNQDMFTDFSAKEQTQLLSILDKLLQKVLKF